MRIIIDPDLANKIFKSDQPSVPEILKNKFISQMIKGCKIVSVFKDDMNATDINSIVIKVIPSLKGFVKNGK